MRAKHLLLSRRHVRRPRDVVVAFFKYPAAGEVKTRLVRDVGMARAAQIYHRLAVTPFRGPEDLNLTLDSPAQSRWEPIWEDPRPS